MDRRPSPVPVPPSVAKQRQTTPFVPSHANMRVKLSVVRNQLGYEIGIGIRGPAVASKETTLADATTILDKVLHHYGSKILQKIPNVGLTVAAGFEDKVDEVDYAAISAKRKAVKHHPVAESAVQPPQGDSPKDSPPPVPLPVPPPGSPPEIPEIPRNQGDTKG